MQADEWEDALEPSAQATADSCPGADGSLDTAGKNAPPAMWQAVAAVARRMVDGGAAAQGMGAPATYCMPKVELHEGTSVAVKAAETRPLTMLQRSPQIVALASNSHLGRLAQAIEAANQRGFVSGRRRVTSVLELGTGS